MSDMKITMVGSAPARVALPIYAAPTHEKGFNTVRPGLETVGCYLIGAAGFAFDSSFIVAAMKKEIGSLASLIESKADCPISIFGHADPTGGDEYNKKLSGRRAMAVFGLLLNDPAVWEDLYKDKPDQGGDDWARKHLMMMLAALPTADGTPYFRGSPSNAPTPDSKHAIEKFQTDNGLAVDGDPGPNTRKKLFEVYMAWLCLDERTGKSVKLEKEQLLGKGAGTDYKGSVQGCGEFNPAFLAGKDIGDDIEVRNAANAQNRRVVLYFFAKGTDVDPEVWVCPSHKDGPAACKKRFWSNGEDRRKPAEEARTFDQTQDTFACRFYHRLAYGIPCERPNSCPMTVDIQLDLPKAKASLADAYELASDDKSYVSVRSRAEAIALSDDALTVRFSKVKPKKKYTLSQIVGETRLTIFDGMMLDHLHEGPDDPPAKLEDAKPEEEPPPPEYVSGEDEFLKPSHLGDDEGWYV